MNWIVAFKWISLVVTCLLAIGGLFYGTYHEDAKTKRRKPTLVGWIVLAILVISFIVSVESTAMESQQNAYDKALKQKQLEGQEKEIESLRDLDVQQKEMIATQKELIASSHKVSSVQEQLIASQKEQLAGTRKIALTQRELEGIEVTLVFPKQRFNELLDLYQSVKDHIDEDLRYEDKGGTTYHSKIITGHVANRDELEDNEEEDFEHFIRALCSGSFAIELNGNTTLARITERDWPSTIQISDCSITMDFKTPGIRLDVLDNARIAFRMATASLASAPTLAVLKSLDMNVVFTRNINLKWNRFEREEESFDLETIKVAFLVSELEPLAVRFKNVLPKERE